jgi:hypothetical protein
MLEARIFEISLASLIKGSIVLWFTPNPSLNKQSQYLFSLADFNAIS